MLFWFIKDVILVYRGYHAKENPVFQFTYIVFVESHLILFILC